MGQTTHSRPPRRPNYGIDAPGLVKGFFVGSALALTCAVGIGLSPWPGGIMGAVGASVTALAACYACGMGCYMLYGSLVVKVRERHRILDLVPWTGGEKVLDVGCGRGLMLVAAAHRIPHGRGIGVDVWRAVDQSGNHPEAARVNAELERVADRIEVQTADARQLPFPDGTFDVVLSHWVVHNLPDPADRARVLAEMCRVLKPDGHLLLADIENHAEYAARLTELGCVGVRREVSRFWDVIRAVISFGSFRPSVIVARQRSLLISSSKTPE